MGKKIALSIVIPAKNKDCQKLKNLLSSIEEQDFPKDLLEVLVITDGTSESAKSIGIKKSQGKIIGIIASDNLLISKSFLSELYKLANIHGASTTSRYHYDPSYCLMDRYFALVGGNDPLSYSLGKNDRFSYIDTPVEMYYRKVFPTYGDNGFFIKKEIIIKSNMDHYYHIDNIWDVFNSFDLHNIKYSNQTIAHLSGEKFFSYFKKRYKYGSQHAFNPCRRWHLVERRDLWRLILFILSSLTIIKPLTLSMRGYFRKKDLAWFMHPIMCLGILFTYAILTIHLLWISSQRWLSALLAGRRV